MRVLPPLVAAAFLALAFAGCFGSSDTPAAEADDHHGGDVADDPSTDPAEPMQMFDRFEERPAGVERQMRLLFGPFPIPAGQDMNRVTLELPVRNGFMTAVSPNLYNAADGLAPTNQHMHIHHAHWFRMSDDPSDQYYTANLAWVFGTGEERTQGSLHDRAAADPMGPRYGIYVEPLTPQVLIYMIHNKMPEPVNVYVALDIRFVYGSAEDIAAAKDCPGLVEGEACFAGQEFHTLLGKLWGATFDVPRVKPEDGNLDGVYQFPNDIAADDGTRQETDDLGRMFTASADGIAIAAAGHLHPNGLDTIIANLGPEGSGCEADLDGDGLPGTTLMRSRKIENVEDAFPHSEEYQMGATKYGWRAPVHAGDRITQFARYANSDYASYEAMSFVGLYVDRLQAPPTPAAGCHAENYAPTLLPGDPWGGDPTETVVNRETHEHGHGGHGETQYCGISGYPACDHEVPEPESGVETAVVSIANFAYTPGDRSLPGQAGNPVQVPRGTTLTFTNGDFAQAGVRHTVTSCTWPCNGPYVANYPNPDGSFDSGKMGNIDPIDGGLACTDGTSSVLGTGLCTESVPTWQLDTSDLEPGLYAFYCRVHPWMRGSLEVT